MTINKDNDCTMILTKVDNTYRTFRFPNKGNVGKNTIWLSCKYLERVQKWLHYQNDTITYELKCQENASKILILQLKRKSRLFSIYNKCILSYSDAKFIPSISSTMLEIYGVLLISFFFQSNFCFCGEKRKSVGIKLLHRVARDTLS